MRVTLKDIAEESGYSISTVSRVLNGSDSISTEVQKHVIKCAEKLNYPFSRSKVNPHSNGNKDIALITDFHEGEFYASYFFGLNNAAIELDVNLNLISITNRDEPLFEIINSLDRHRFDGIILFIAEMKHTEYTTLKKKLAEAGNDIPIVSNALIQNPVFPTITFDGYSGGHMAADYLINKGYAPLGILKGPFEKAESRFRYNGFYDHCTHMEVDVCWEFTGDFMFNSGVKAFKDYYQSPNKPQAIFISNDLMTLGFVEAARMEEVKIPEDVAIISYDDLPMCEQMHPNFTSIKTNFGTLGELSLQAINDLISEKQNNKGTLSLIPVNISERNSA